MRESVSPQETTKMSEGKTVYFLGAGASNASDFGLPTMDRFFRKEDPVLKDFSDLRKFIENTFPRISIEKLNLEEIITYLELSIDRFGRFGKCPDGYLYNAREQFAQYVRRRLIYEPVEGKDWCSKFKRIFQDLKEKDTIITLNYDLVAENTLNAIPRERSSKQNHPLYDKMINLLSPPIICDIAIERRNSDSGLYLKLHGSIDWYYCLNQDCLNHWIMTILPISRVDSLHLCNFCGFNLDMAIVPPTMDKAFKKYPRLGVIWSLARQELISSTSSVFIGVSFRPSDYYLSWLIKSSFLGTSSKDKSVVVVDKNKSVIHKIQDLIGKEPVYYNNIDSYISSKEENKKEIKRKR